MKRKRSILVAAMLGVLLLAAAGCGGGSSSANGTSPTTTSGSGGPTGGTGPTGATTTTSTSSSGLGSLASAANCRQLSDLGAQLSAAFAGHNGDIQTQAALMQQFADRTPSDIRPDFEVYASTFSKIANALKGVNLSSGRPSATAMAKLMTLSTQVNQAALTTASLHIATWASQNCHA
jgi:hypothetical protein